VTEPQPGAHRADRRAPEHGARHLRRRERRRRWSLGLAPLTVVVLTMLGLVAGLGAGWALDKGARGERPVAAGGGPTPTPERVPVTPSGEASAPAAVLDERVDAAADRFLLPSAPTGPTVAAPQPIDPLATDAAGLTVADRQAGLLSTAVPASAGGTLVVVPGSSPAPEPGTRVRTVRVEVEQGLDIDPALFADAVMVTLNDPRGWGGDGSMSFARTDGDAELRVVLASPALVDQLCAPLKTEGTVSCGREGRAVINHVRWVQATQEFTDKAVYRQYVVNHEVGHLLGHGHVECPGAGAVAPVMQQQTVQVAPCTANGWPFPG
jgi:hypothetical protein